MFSQDNIFFVLGKKNQQQNKTQMHRQKYTYLLHTEIPSLSFSYVCLEHTVI